MAGAVQSPLASSETPSVNALRAFVRTTMSSSVDQFRAALFDRFRDHGSDQLDQLVAEVRADAEDARSCVETMVTVASVLSEWYDRSGQLEFLHAAIRVSQEFVSVPSQITSTSGVERETPEEYFSAYERLALDLMKKCLAVPQNEDFDRVQEIVEFGINNGPTAKKAYFQSLGANFLLLVYQFTHEYDDLTQAIEMLEMLRKPQAATPASLKPTIASNLLTARLHLNDVRQPTLDDMNADVELAKETVDQTLEDDPQRPSRVNRLCSLLILRYETAGDERDLVSVLERLEQVKDFPGISMRTKRFILSNLSIALRRLYEHTGDESYLMRSLTEANFLLQTSQTDADRITYLHAHLTTLRLARTLPNYTDSLTKAITEFQACVENSDSHPSIAMFWSSIGNALMDLYQRTSSEETLNQAYEILRRAASKSRDDPNILHSFASAGTVYLERPGRRDAHEIKEVIDVSTRVVELSRADNSSSRDRAIFLNNLSRSLLLRGTEIDAKNARNFSLEALSCTFENHPNWPIFQFTLAKAHTQIAEITEDESAWEESITAYERIFRSEIASYELRIMSAIELVNIISKVDATKAYIILRGAVELLPLASSRALARIDQQFALSKFSGLASAAASLALNANESTEAIRLLEVGRGILAGYNLETKTDLDDLQVQHPNLAESFRDLQNQLQMSDLEAQTYTRETRKLEPVVLTLSLKKKQISDHLQQLIAEIRSKDDRFLRGPSDEELRAMATPGPIVFLNAAEPRCDALILEKARGLTVVRLEIEKQEVDAWARKMKSILGNRVMETYHEAESQVRRLLAWLWDKVVYPILKSLGFARDKANVGQLDNLPMIWWVPCGVFASLPLHAAGDHTKGSVQNTLDCVVSVYAPTLRTLAYARKQMSSPSTDPGKSFNTFLAMPETPGRDPLPGVQTDAKLISDRLKIDIVWNPTKTQALELLGRSTIGVFACHGDADESNPSKSQLVLQDWQEDPLTVTDIERMHSKRSQLAIMLACHSARNPNTDLADEAIHLAAAMQIAGYPRVIGNLWEVGDRESSALLDEIMRDLTQEGYGQVAFDRLPRALHQAVRLLRDQTRTKKGTKRELPHKPLIWAPYVCMTG
jgi:CHAT domain-containing protein